GAGGGGDRGQGQADLEAGAGAAEGGVTDDQLPVLGAGQLAGNVEAEADPAGPPGGAGVELGEALEDALAVGRLDPGAGVLDGQHGQGAVAGRLQADRAVVGRVLGRVVEQVAEHLEDGLGGGPNGQDLPGDQRQLPARVGDPGRGQGVAGQGGRVDQRR